VTAATLAQSGGLLRNVLLRCCLHCERLLVAVVAMAATAVPLFGWRLALLEEHALQMMLLRWLVPSAPLALAFLLSLCLRLMPVLAVDRRCLAVWRLLRALCESLLFSRHLEIVLFNKPMLLTVIGGSRHNLRVLSRPGRSSDMNAVSVRATAISNILRASGALHLRGACS
jgi:hypothetical protein